MVERTGRHATYSFFLATCSHFREGAFAGRFCIVEKQHFILYTKVSKQRILL